MLKNWILAAAVIGIGSMADAAHARGRLANCFGGS